MFADMPLEQLREYRPERREPAGFDAFWERTLKETRRHDPGAVFTEVETGLALVRRFDVRYAGFGGHEIRGWFLAPATAKGALPCAVEHIRPPSGAPPLRRHGPRRLCRTARAAVADGSRVASECLIRFNQCS